MPVRRLGRRRTVGASSGSDVQLDPVRVDGLVRVLVAVRVRHEVAVGPRHEYGRPANDEGVDDARGDRHRPALRGEVVGDEVLGTLGVSGVQDTATRSLEDLVEVVVVVPQGDLHAGDGDPRQAVELVRGAGGGVDELRDGTPVVRVDERHLGLVDETRATDADGVGHDGPLGSMGWVGLGSATIALTVA